MSPKSLLRHREAVCSLDDLANGSFQTVIDDPNVDPKKVKRVVACCGKVYYDLLATQRDGELDDIAIIRIEQLYPFPDEYYAAALNRYKKATDIVWCQEEPMNQGAWYQIRHRMVDHLKNGQKLRYAGRDASASTAAGYNKVHVAQQKELVEQAMGEVKLSKADRSVSKVIKKRAKKS